MARRAVEALLAEHERAVNTLSHLIVNWTETEMDRVLPNDPGMTCTGVMKHCILCGYSYFRWIQKVVDLPRVVAPVDFKDIDQAGHKELLDLLEQLVPFATESLSTLVDQQLEDEGYKSSWEREYTIEQMLEHAIVHLWRHNGQLRRTDEYYLNLQTRT